MRWWNKRIFLVFSSLLFGSILVVAINAIIIYFSQKQTNDKYISSKYSDFSNSNDQDIRKFFKQNTVSMSIIENETTKTNGTAWLYDWNHKNNTYTFITNLHVFSPFIEYDKNTNDAKLINQSFKSINIRYFNNVNDDKLSMIRTNFDNWSISKLDNIFLSRMIPKRYNNSNNTKTINNKCYIDNGYIDYIKITYHSSNNYFDNWLKTDHTKPEIMNINEHNINDLKELYIAGFPIINNKPTWTEQKIPNNKTNVFISNTVKELSPDAWMNDNNNIYIETNNKKINLRSVSNQIVVKELRMGAGSSGSMMITRHENKIKIIGIWWGTYGNHSGAIDLLNTNSFIPYDSYMNNEWLDIVWQEYYL